MLIKNYALNSCMRLLTGLYGSKLATPCDEELPPGSLNHDFSPNQQQTLPLDATCDTPSCQTFWRTAASFLRVKRQRGRNTMIHTELNFLAIATPLFLEMFTRAVIFIQKYCKSIERES